MTEVRMTSDPLRKKMDVTVSLSEKFLVDNLLALVMEKTAKLMAEKIVAEKFQEIIKVMDPQAIANLSLAESAAAISKTLKEKIPDKILEIHHVEDKGGW